MGVVELSEQGDLVYEGLLALLAGVLPFFRKCLDCDHLLIEQPLGQVDSRKGSPTNLLLGPEERVEVALVDPVSEKDPPSLDHLEILGVELENLELLVILLPFESDADGPTGNGFVLG